VGQRDKWHDFMPSEDSFFQPGDAKSIWRRYCGPLFLSLEDFMEVQNHLLNERLDLLAQSRPEKGSMTGLKLAGVDEFRRLLPLTKYKDYLSSLSSEQDNSGADDGQVWVQTSAPGGTFKHVPWTYRFQRVQWRNVIGALILASARAQEEIAVAPGIRALIILPPQPFASACLASCLSEQFPAQILPPLDIGQKLPFRRRIDLGLQLALVHDLDYVISMTSSLLVTGERASRMANRGGIPLSITKLNHRVLWRLLWRRFGFRRNLAPRHLWSVKGIVSWGADTDIFKKRIEAQWGRPLYQLYASSESGIIAMQESLKGPLAFLPDSVFLEFLPEEEKEAGDDARTVLISEVEDGKLYEPVITNFYGMPFLRYRQGDLVRIHRDDSGKVPRMSFYGRADDVIDLYGIARLNTQTVSRALELAGVTHGNWCLRKEYEGDKAILMFYIEVAEGTQATEIERLLHRGLKAADQHYREAVYTMAFNPTRVTALPQGTFQRLAASAGGSSRQMKMNPPDSLIQELMTLSRQTR
jgi:hypothetical protein